MYIGTTALTLKLDECDYLFSSYFYLMVLFLHQNTRLLVFLLLDQGLC